MTGPELATWRDELARAVARAPGWMRALASDELHIGGFTNVQIDHPVLDVREIDDPARAERALLFFAAAALLRGAAAARVHCGRGPGAAALSRAARRQLRGALERIDDENLPLVRYFDLYLRPAAAIDVRVRTRVLRLAERAVGAAEEG